jgi:hypothetical protein
VVAALATTVALTTVVGCGGDDAPAYAVDGCERADLDGRSVARVWDETTLDLIRQVIPAPTVHARNLFHVSAAMWDAWAAYDDVADGYFVAERASVDGGSEDVAAAREASISYAAYRILLWRYATVSDLPSAADDLDAVMASLCYRTDFTAVDGSSPAALGNRIAETVLATTRDDGSLEDERYVDTTYRPVNDPLVVADPGTDLADPDRWQPLSLGTQITQNGLEVPGHVQEFIGPHWGHVASFALPVSDHGTPIDPGPPPRLGDPETAGAYRDAAVAVIRYGSLLDATDGVEIDIGPAARGDNTLGTNDGDGYDRNPATGEPYDPDIVLQGDFGRVIAEFWADGPDSETPPGHWNVLANSVADAPGFERRIGGDGPVVDALEWDVTTYFVLNGALHDAAIAAWGLKGWYDSVRPISMIRYLGGLGQSSDPDAPGYDPEGLPLVPGLIEVVTEASSAPGERHAHLAGHEGEVVVRGWRGGPHDPKIETSGVGWIRAVEWVPYQRPSFVSPSFAGYVSGHSSFSRAGAEVLAAITGDPYFPGGLAEWTVEAGTLRHEEGPTADVTLEWATYFDAADQAGISRLYGGIHIPEDDLPGRVIGAQCGRGAWTEAQPYLDGTARE